MEYTKILPGEILRPYVHYFALLEEPSHVLTKRFNVIVEGRPGLIFQHNPNSFFDEHKNQLPQLFLHGITTSHLEKTTLGSYSNVVVSLKPNALSTIFGLDAHELTDKYAGLNEIIRNDLTDRILYETHLSGKIEVISHFILDQAKKNSSKKSANSDSLMEVLQTQRFCNLKDIQRHFNLSERSLERKFKYEVGVSPKMFIRIKRFQNALDQIRQQKFESLSQTAYEHFYYDQSHYISDFKKFAGTTPKQFLLHANEEVENFSEWCR